MEIILDTEAVAIIRQAFQCCDIDGDGCISRDDLRISSGLDEDVDTIFSALKASTDSNPITFDEFKKGIMDFPFLLEQFKQEYQSKSTKIKPKIPKLCIKIEEAEDEYISTRDSPTFMLQRVFGHFQDAVHEMAETVSAPEPGGSPFSIRRRADSLDECRRLLTSLLRNCDLDNPTFYVSIIKGAISLLDFIESERSKYLDQIDELRSETHNKKMELKSSELNNERLQARNEELLDALSKLESENSRRFEDHISAVNEKNKLQNLLKNNEAKSKLELGSIQSVIELKEDAIKNLEKEIRRLISYKTIQELSYKKEFSPETFRKNRINSYTPRNVMPTTSPLISPKAIKLQRFNSHQFDLQKVTNSNHDSKSKEFHSKETVYLDEIEKLKLEIATLREKDSIKKTAEMSTRNISICEDLQLLKDIPGIDKFSLNSSQEVMNYSTQSIMYESGSITKKRRCCGIFGL